MGKVLQARLDQVASDFMASDGTPHYNGEVFEHESVYTTTARQIGSLSIDGKLSLLREMAEEGFEKDPKVALYLEDDMSIMAVLDNLLTSVVEIELLRTNSDVAAEDDRRYEAFSAADIARFAVA